MVMQQMGNMDHVKAEQICSTWLMFSNDIVAKGLGPVLYSIVYATWDYTHSSETMG